MAPQNSQNCGRHLRKRKQSDAEFAGNGLLRILIIDIVINTLLGRVTPDILPVCIVLRGTMLLFLVFYAFYLSVCFFKLRIKNHLEIRQRFRKLAVQSAQTFNTHL